MALSLTCSLSTADATGNANSGKKCATIDNSNFGDMLTGMLRDYITLLLFI